ncbi:hypothetical protein NZD88_03430 [Chryseobacterium antibioticum]|uniref:Uncharacterized protein n=1 Tax=Chryseobacterium pyrolae TaxID=2987481 RepID=A0ABT2IDA5_9FLAO|nr:hypothetical protein [Chryseobacterium pyrolae]MCT2406606.1 hypothetical protein [Chryseobacterium pyrolae]
MKKLVEARDQKEKPNAYSTDDIKKISRFIESILFHGAGTTD